MTFDSKNSESIDKRTTWEGRTWRTIFRLFLVVRNFSRQGFFSSCRRKNERNVGKVKDARSFQSKNFLTIYRVIAILGHFRKSLHYYREPFPSPSKQQQSSCEGETWACECVISCGCAFPSSSFHTLTHTQHINCACQIDNLLRAEARTFEQFLPKLQQFYFTSHRVNFISPTSTIKNKNFVGKFFVEKTYFLYSLVIFTSRFESLANQQTNPCQTFESQPKNPSFKFARKKQSQNGKKTSHRRNVEKKLHENNNNKVKQHSPLYLPPEKKLIRHHSSVWSAFNKVHTEKALLQYFPFRLFIAHR